MPTHRVMQVVRPAFGAEGSQFLFKSVGRQPEAQLQGLRGILRRPLSDSSQFDCSFERSGVNLGAARVVRAVLHGAGSPRRAGTALPSSPLHGGTTSCVQVVRGRAAAAQAPSAHGLGPVRVRRAVAAVRAVPFGPRAAGCAPRPLGVESSGRAAPLPVRDECGFWIAPQPLAAECCKVKSVARAHGAPCQFTETIMRRTTLSAVVKLYYIVWQRRVCCRSADGSQPRRLLHHKGWAQCGSGAPLRRHVPFRVVPERPVTRLAHWGWRAAGTQRLTLLRVSAALWLRLGRSRLSAARSSRLRGRVGAFARCALLVKGGPDGATRQGLRAWRSLQAEAARYGLKYFGLCPPPRAWWHMWCTLSSTELDERAQGRKATRQGLVLPGRLPVLGPSTPKASSSRRRRGLWARGWPGRARVRGRSR